MKAFNDKIENIMLEQEAKENRGKNKKEARKGATRTGGYTHLNLLSRIQGT